MDAAIETNIPYALGVPFSIFGGRKQSFQTQALYSPAKKDDT